MLTVREIRESFSALFEKCVHILIGVTCGVKHDAKISSSFSIVRNIEWNLNYR